MIWRWRGVRHLRAWWRWRRVRRWWLRIEGYEAREALEQEAALVEQVLKGER